MKYCYFIFCLVFIVTTSCSENSDSSEADITEAVEVYSDLVVDELVTELRNSGINSDKLSSQYPFDVLSKSLIDKLETSNPFLLFDDSRHNEITELLESAFIYKFENRYVQTDSWHKSTPCTSSFNIHIGVASGIYFACATTGVGILPCSFGFGLAVLAAEMAFDVCMEQYNQE